MEGKIYLEVRRRLKESTDSFLKSAKVKVTGLAGATFSPDSTWDRIKNLVFIMLIKYTSTRVSLHSHTPQIHMTQVCTCNTTMPTHTLH